MEQINSCIQKAGGILVHFLAILSSLRSKNLYSFKKDVVLFVKTLFVTKKSILQYTH